jgi:outer membrane immunogenic protein
MSSISRFTEFRALAFAAISVAALPGSALAADLPPAPPPMKAAYVPAPVYNWTGCYVGGNVGFGWQDNHAYDPQIGFYAGGETANGVVGGGQIGCDWQTGPWVFGFQGMFDGTDLNSSHINPISPTGADALGTNTRWFATQTARIGMTVTPQALFYVKGGAAEASFNYSDNDPTVPYYGSASATRFGWTVGAGFEYSFAPNWSAFVEYNYMGFGSNATTLTYTAPNPANATPYIYNETNNLQTVLVGVNYRFNLGGPVVARY